MMDIQLDSSCVTDAVDLSFSQICSYNIYDQGNITYKHSLYLTENVSPSISTPMLYILHSNLLGMY